MAQAKKRRKTRKNPQLYAQPYDMDAKGFYFEDFEDYKDKYSKNFNSWGGQVEEYEFQFIDGDKGELAIWNALEVGQGDLEKFFELAADMDEDDIPKLHYLMEYMNFDLADALDKMEELHLREGEGHHEDKVLENYARERLNELGMPENAEYYFDEERWGRDLRINGERGYDPDDESDLERFEEELEEKEGDLESKMDAVASDKSSIKSMKGHHYYSQDDIAEVEKTLAYAEENVEELEGEIEELEEKIEEFQGNIDYWDKMSDKVFGEEMMAHWGGVEHISPETIKSYFDFEKYGRDMTSDGEVDVFKLDGTYYIAEPHSI